MEIADALTVCPAFNLVFATIVFAPPILFVKIIVPEETLAFIFDEVPGVMAVVTNDMIIQSSLAV